MREFRRAEDAERRETSDAGGPPAELPDRPYGAPAAAPERPGVVRRSWSEVELPEEPTEGPIGGPVTWARDAMDRAFSPNAIDHRHTIEVDHPDLPPRPPMRYDLPMVRDGDRYVDPPLWNDAGPRRQDVRQGVIGDCWALSSMGAVAGHDPEAIRGLVHEETDGYTVRLHHARREEGSGDWIPTGHRLELTITRAVPHLDDTPELQAGANVVDTRVAWTSAVEKALAGVDQAWGKQRDHLEFDDARGYARLVGGTEHEIAEVLTQVSGERAGVVVLDRDTGWQQRTEDLLREQVEAGRAVIVGTRGESEVPLGNGLRPGHAYEVTEVRDGRVHLWNPWGVLHPNPMSIADFMKDTRGKIATVAADEARERYQRG